LKILHFQGKDSQHVFFKGQLLDKADSYSFQVLQNNYARDRFHVFHHGRIIERVQSQSSLNSCYPSQSQSSTSIPSYDIQDFKVFFGDQYVSDARWIDFTNLGHGYGKDIFRVFYMGHSIPNAHSFSFEVLTKGYAKDKNCVYHNGQLIPGVQPHSFQPPSNS